MLNIRKIDLTKRYVSLEAELRSVKSYIYQLVEELQFRSEQLDQTVKDEASLADTKRMITEALAAAKAYADSVASGGGGGGSGEANVIEVIKVNGSALTVTNKAVDITVPSYTAGTGIDITGGVISLDVDDGDEIGYGNEGG